MSALSARLANRVRKQPVVAFYVLTFAITWGSWFPMAAHNRGLLPVDLPLLFFLGGLGPGIAAYVVMRALRGKRGDAELLGPLLRWRVGVPWLLVSILLFVVIWLLASTVSSRLDEELAVVQVWPGLVLLAVRYLLAAVPEEVGWRGFALPALQQRFSALTSSLIIGAVWALWHLPLLVGGDPVMSTYPLIPYLVYIVAESVLYTWLYNNTGGSLLLAVLAHGASNVVGPFGAAPVATAVITAALAIAVVAIFGPRHLTRTGQRITLARDQIDQGPRSRHRPAHGPTDRRPPTGGSNREVNRHVHDS
jgi:membrane protease YdiL (CAAX protease family)